MINNVINIIQILTIAINSMAARFISISMHQKDYQKACRYFTSVLYSNIIMTAILLIPTIVAVIFVNKIFVVPLNLIDDVKISFGLMMCNFFITLCFSVFTVGTFVTDRLDLNYIRTIISHLIRGGVIVVLFGFLNPSISFYVVATLLATLYTVITNARLTKKLTPELKIRKKYFDIVSIKELMSAGIWNSIGTLSYDLFNGIDLIVANVCVSATAMGVLSVSKTIPTTVNTLVTMVVALFMPSLVKYYAEDSVEKIVEAFKTTNKIMVLIIVPVISFMIGFGDEFYKLWMPSLEAKQLQLLTVMTLLPLYISIGSKGLANIFTVVNRIKIPTLVTLCLAACSTLSVFILLVFTELGIYAIVGASSFFLIIKELVFVPVYAAKCLNVKKYNLYKLVLKSNMIVAVSAIISIISSSFVDVTGWGSLILYAAVSSLIICIINIAIIMQKEDYTFIISKFRGRKLKQ